jgi:hypothetical protein
MRAMDLIWFACLRAALDMMRPKRRLLYLKAVSALIGDPNVIPCVARDKAAEVALARETWIKMVSEIIDTGA